VRDSSKHEMVVRRAPDELKQGRERIRSTG
jgi:hypothetical protein